MSRSEIIVGDCRAVLRAMPPNSIDAFVTDPPYEIGFMQRKWDSSGVAFDVKTWSEVLRVLKPGGYLLAFSGSRTSHRMTVAIEDAGFEIRDAIENFFAVEPEIELFLSTLDDAQRAAFVRLVEFGGFGGVLSWMYGQGFPKSLDASKAIDGAAGATRKIVGQKRGQGNIPNDRGSWGLKPNVPVDVTEAATDAAKRWEGWGTALKPAHEPIVVARKPFKGTLASNLLVHGTGAINIDGCRRPTADALGGGAENADTVCATNHEGWDRQWKHDADSRAAHAARVRENVSDAERMGRWPPNVVLDEASAAALDEQSGERPGRVGMTKHSGTNRVYGEFKKSAQSFVQDGIADVGGASRFFYVPKSTRRERDKGCAHMERKTQGQMTDRVDGTAAMNSPRTEAGRKNGAKNFHPTVKPVALMQWLVRLVTPPSGTVCDCFVGSGSTGVAAFLEGFDFVGIDTDPEYAEIARARIAGAQPLFAATEIDDVAELVTGARASQSSLWGDEDGE